MRENARQCAATESTMRYWKCIRYPVSREFTASGHAVVFHQVERRAKRRSATRNFISTELRFDLSSPTDGRMVPDDRCTLRLLRSTTPHATPLPVIRPCWNIACYTSDRVPTSLEARFIKTDDWFVRLVSPRKRRDLRMFEIFDNW